MLRSCPFLSRVMVIIKFKALCSMWLLITVLFQYRCVVSVLYPYFCLSCRWRVHTLIGALIYPSVIVQVNEIGGRSNTGEGGEDAARFKDNRRSAIKQVRTQH